MATLPCEDGGGSLNNPNNPTLPEVAPYVPPQLCVGNWQLTNTNPDTCELNDQRRQEAYVAEILNINGAPINIYKLLGIHEQGNGSITSQGRVIGSQSFPGYPLAGINVGPQPWRTLQQGANIVTSAAYVGVDFGIKLLPSPLSGTEYEPEKQNWTKVGAINLTQANTPNEYARQVRVDYADGTCEIAAPFYSGTGNGTITFSGLGRSATQGVVTAVALTPTTFNVYATLPDSTVIALNTATVGVPFFSTFINFTISEGSTPFVGGDMFSVQVNYVWKRVGMFNLVQSPLPQTLNFHNEITVKAIRVVPTMFTGTGSWEVSALDVLDSPPTNINNIQDLFFNENRDRDYAKTPLLVKCQYNPVDSMSDLAKFGINILDQYSFTLSFASMVQVLGRPIVVGDIIEVIPELQYDHNLKPIRKFLEVTDTGWAAEGFSTHWKPTLYRFTGQQALPSQETRDIFGTMDTQKYLIADQVLMGTAGQQLDTTPLTISEEIAREAADKVPETGSDDQRYTIGSPLPNAAPIPNVKGNVPPGQHNGKQGIYIEDGLPPNGEPYGEGYKFPDAGVPVDGEYYRLYYPPETKIPPRLYRWSSVKNRWIFVETDRRGDYSSHKPSIRTILQSDTKQGLGKKSS